MCDKIIRNDEKNRQSYKSTYPNQANNLDTIYILPIYESLLKRWLHLWYAMESLPGQKYAIEYLYFFMSKIKKILQNTLNSTLDVKVLFGLTNKWKSLFQIKKEFWI